MVFLPLSDLSVSALHLLEMVMCATMLSPSFALLLAKCAFFFLAFSPHVYSWNERVRKAGACDYLGHRLRCSAWNSQYLCCKDTKSETWCDAISGQTKAA